MFGMVVVKRFRMLSDMDLSCRGETASGAGLFCWNGMDKEINDTRKEEEEEKRSNLLVRSLFLAGDG